MKWTYANHRYNWSCTGRVGNFCQLNEIVFTMSDYPFRSCTLWGNQWSRPSYKLLLNYQLQDRYLLGGACYLFAEEQTAVDPRYARFRYWARWDERLTKRTLQWVLNSTVVTWPLTPSPKCQRHPYSLRSSNPNPYLRQSRFYWLHVDQRPSNLYDWIHGVFLKPFLYMEVTAVSGFRIILPHIFRSFTDDEGLEPFDRHWDIEYSKACLKGGEWVRKLKFKLTLTFCHRRCGPTKNWTLFDVENGTWT